MVFTNISMHCRNWLFSLDKTLVGPFQLKQLTWPSPFGHVGHWTIMLSKERSLPINHNSFKSQWGQQDEQHCPTIGQFETALSDHWTVGQITVRPLDSWTLSWPAIGQFNTTLTNHWTVGPRTVQPLDTLKEHYLTFTQLDTALSDHWTVGQSTVWPLDGWTLS